MALGYLFGQENKKNIIAYIDAYDTRAIVTGLFRVAAASIEEAEEGVRNKIREFYGDKIADAAIIQVVGVGKDEDYIVYVIYQSEIKFGTITY